MQLYAYIYIKINITVLQSSDTMFRLSKNMIIECFYYFLNKFNKCFTKIESTFHKYYFTGKNFINFFYNIMLITL